MKTEVKLDKRLQDELRTWLHRQTYSHFATLSFNDPTTTYDTAKRKLRAWDARLCRAILGSRWQRKPDERLVWIAICEKPDCNPHWHLLINALPDQHAALDEHLERAWIKLVPSGTANLQVVSFQKGAIAYVTKAIRNPVSYEGFCHSLEFIRARA